MGCKGPEGHDGKDPRNYKKENHAESLEGDHVGNNAENFRIEASPKKQQLKDSGWRFHKLRKRRERP